MKRRWTLVLSMLLLALLCVSAQAADSDYDYKGDGYYAINKYTGAETDIVIPDTLKGSPVHVLNQNAISKAASALSITLPESMRCVDGFNFYKLYELTSVTLNEGLTMIDESNFIDCDKLEELTIPASVRYIGSNCIKYNDVLTTVRFLGECPTFEENCFMGAHSDMVVYVPDDQLDAYKAALPQGINIAPSGKSAVIVEPEMDESLYSFDAETGTITGYNGMASYVSIPAQIGGVAVKAIGSYAFCNDNNKILTHVVIPEGVQSLGKAAFDHTWLLVDVQLPSTLRHIGDDCFWVALLPSLKLNDGLETIGTRAFMDCNMSTLVIPDSVKSIGQEAFSRCYISDLTLGAGVETLGEKAFFENSLKAMRFNMETVPAVGAQALSGKNKEPALTLADGITEETYNAYVALMAEQFPACVVNMPALKPEFPALDAAAGEPFFGVWHSVAVNDGTDYYAAELLGMVMDAAFNPDGTCSMTIEGEAMQGCWYMDGGAAIFAPILEEGGKPALEEALPFTIDENGRIVIDLGGIFVFFEKEGALYSTPAIPEKPWPELDADNAKGFIGTWEAVSYTMDGETHDAALVGAMTLILNGDGTAQTIEEGGEPFDLRWYADYGMAYVGPTVNTAATVTFDGNGNITMEQDGAVVLMKPYEEPAANPTEGGEMLIGEWLDDVGNKLTLAADGTLSLTYASDGWTDKDQWAVADGAAVVTSGRWEGCPITLENGILTITNGEGIFQIYSVDGDLSAYYGAGEQEMPEATPVGPEGDAFLGAWAADMGGMEMILTLNADGTCTMDMLGETEYGVWTAQDGKAYVMGDELSIDDQGKLVMPAAGMVFVKSEGGASGEEMSEEEQMAALIALLAQMEEEESGMPEHLAGYVGEWYMAYMNFGGMSGDPKAVLGLDSVMTINADGTATVGFPIDKSGNWYEEDGNVYFGEEGMPLTLLSDGCLQYGSQLGGYFVFSRDKDASWEPTAGQAMTLAPGVSNLPGATAAAQSAGFATMEDRLEKKFIAKSYTSFGQTMDASMLGAEYAVVFHENGLADFTLSGVTVPGLPWGLQKVAVGLSSVDAFVINYYGSMFNAVLTDAGFDMDYYGTMTLHFIPAQ